MVRQRNILDCWWRVVTSSSSITSIRVRWLRWWWKVDDGWLLSRVDNWSRILDLRSVILLLTGGTITLLRWSLVRC